MTLRTADRVKETSKTTGTGDITLDGAVTGHQRFQDAIPLNDTFKYCITDGIDWEVGEGTLISNTVLRRDVVNDSSNGGALVSWFANNKEVFITNAAEDVHPDGFPTYISDTQPDTDKDKYLWIQTGLGTSGDDFTFWFEDGT